MSITVTDLVLITALLWAAWKGFSRGLIIEVASLVALVLGTFAAIRFSGFASRIILGYMDMDPRVLHVLSFSLTFLAVMLVVILLGRILEKMVNLIMLGLLNKIAGAVFGTLKVAVVLSVIMLLVNAADPSHKLIPEKERQGSRLYFPVERLAPLLMGWLGMDEIPIRPVELEPTAP
ncbi:MAG TPA: CvpA family protein [Bacteroidales bacterium]|nr:CvpA family protein [Bacteroidales bacterium]HRZ76170.1 CvpA family protein [Bacteroidales bacterium]